MISTKGIYIYIYVCICRGRTPNKVNKMCTHRRNLKLPHFTTYMQMAKMLPISFFINETSTLCIPMSRDENYCVSRSMTFQKNLELTTADPSVEENVGVFHRISVDQLPDGSTTNPRSTFLVRSGRVRKG